MTPETYLLYIGVLAAFFATPPDTSQLLIISNSLRHGLRRALATVAGDLSANVLQMTAAAFGLTALIAASADALAVVKWVGVAYLAWIGLTLILRSGKSGAAAPKTQPRHLFRQGFLTSSANPYAVVFFGALFPQFIDASQPIAPQLLILWCHLSGGRWPGGGALGVERGTPNRPNPQPDRPADDCGGGAFGIERP